MRVKFSLLLIGILAQIQLFAQVSETQNFKTEYVIILVIDGPRYTETFGDTSCANIPNLCNELAPQGVLYTNFRANAPRTTTNAGHTAITTGVNQRISNDGKQLPKYPSIFQYYMKQKDIDKNKLWVISSKGKLSILGNTNNKNWHDLYTPHVYCGKNGNGAEYVSDARTWEQVKWVVDEYQPKLMLVNLLAPDTYGHGNNWEGYIQAIKNSDKYAMELWNRIQANPKMKDKTTLFITNDHGRNADGHKDGFVSHGDGTESNRHIFLLAMGPDFKKNIRYEIPRELTDISRTLALLLGFDIPTSRGCVMTESFIEN